MIQKKLKKKVRDYLAATYTRKIQPESPAGFHPKFNQACHFNSDHLQKTGEAIAVVECLIINNEAATLHYISLMANGSYVDATLGAQWSDSDYRMVRIMREFDRYPYDVLCERKKQLTKDAGVSLHWFKIFDAHWSL